MDEARFRFSEKDQPSEFTSSTASSMQHCYPPDWVLSAPHLLREVLFSYNIDWHFPPWFDFKAIKNWLDYLTDDKFRVVFVAKEISENLPLKERWYGTEYSCEPLSGSLLKVRLIAFLPNRWGHQRIRIDSGTTDARSKSLYSEEFCSPSQRSWYSKSLAVNTLRDSLRKRQHLFGILLWRGSGLRKTIPSGCRSFIPTFCFARMPNHDVTLTFVDRNLRIHPWIPCSQCMSFNLPWPTSP